MALGFISMMLTGCIVVADYEYGPHGNDGRAYFGVDYDHFEPYSYWDNNFSTPDQMWYGEMYRSQPGTYDFEYFINEDEYWYGTYSLYVNAGQPGQPYNQPGLDGEDTNLLLICNYNGFYFESWETCNCLRSGDDQHQVIEMTQGKHNFKIEMWKTNVRDRAPKGTNKMKGI
ncbi:MAG: hypothetical protein HRT74_00920 [Flavobacteriales bacterium]|nr:hypothetical protein [Flavobacteriales bacterium]